MEDKWIPKSSLFSLSMLQCTRDLNMRVSELINWPSRSWNLGLLEARVSGEEIDVIKAIPISLYPKADRLVGTTYNMEIIQ